MTSKEFIREELKVSEEKLWEVGIKETLSRQW